ncbi:MAG: response regulator, partial [Leptospiraceae bacterium]|nr:response regulator [Leptospiraceae bacterium]
LINNFYQIVSTIVTKNNGYIENFSGDFTWSIFPNSPSEALKSGIEIKSKLDELNLSRKEKNQLLIRAGFGLHTDEISVGIVGNSHRMDSILFGEAVEVAQRIEKLTNSFKTWLLLSEQTAIKLGEENDFHVREIDIVKFKNKENLIAIYECYDIDSLDIKSKKEEYKLDLNMGIAMLRENEFKEAETIFKKCLKYCPEDPIPVIYISKCHEKNSETFELSKDNEKPNILIIDDNEMIISLAERFLLKHKFKVISANSGAQALPLYTNFNPDLILLDLHFPDKNGFDIIIDIRELESQFPNQSKIILMTADNSAEIIYRGEELGVDGFIIKPIFEETLIKKIQEVLKSPINL